MVVAVQVREGEAGDVCELESDELDDVDDEGVEQEDGGNGERISLTH